MYYVQSAYRTCVSEIADKSHLHVPRRWNLIWKLRVPPKVKNFYGVCVVVAFQHVLVLAVEGHLVHLIVFIVIAIMKVASISSLSSLKLFKCDMM